MPQGARISVGEGAAAAELERYLHEQIPLTRAMEVSVEEAGEARVVLRAPLSPNINHQETAFGGSVSTLAILAGWSLIHLCLESEGLGSQRIVIQRNRMEFLHPVEGDFEAVAEAPDPEAWRRFSRTLRKRGLGRIAVEAWIREGRRVAARFAGDYVALP